VAGAGNGAGDLPVTVAVRVKPGAGRTRAGGCHDGPHGPALIVAVGAPAVDGRATEAVRRTLAAALGVRPAAVTLRLGATSRDKVFVVEAPAGPVDRRLRELRDGTTPDGTTPDGTTPGGTTPDGSPAGGDPVDGSAAGTAKR
jgi:uncharacterized protein YggU (UPF0235/DUF167 family)